MKKYTIIALCLLFAVVANATVTFTGNDLKIKPGESKDIEICLTNDENFEGFQIDLVLPEGITVQGTSKKQKAKLVGILEELDYDYSVGNTEAGNFGIRVYSTEQGATITPSEGVAITVSVKADDNISIGEKEIKIINIILSKAGQAVDLDDVSFKAMVVKEVSISAASANETFGSIEGNTGTVETGTSISLTATAAEGYHFVNWTAGETAVSTDNPYSFTAEESVSLTANFAPNQYAMTFVLDNGADNVVLTQDYATELSAPADPTKTGFTFAGWDPEVPATVPASAQTFTAQWTRNNYNLTFVVDGESTTTSVAYEAAITAPEDPVKEGYTFTGWDAEIAETMPAQDLTYTAQFTINQYAMTFVLDNGQDNVVLTQDYATELSAPADPTKTGFTFAGWSPAVPATVPASAQTFTAQWTRNNYNLTFVVDGESTTTSVAYEAPITAPADPVKEGYTFTGWDAEIAETMPAQDLTYTAQFTINQYAMTFVLDNGQDNVVLTQDYATELSAPADPTKTGFTFAGWSPAVPATVPAAAQTFTAQWTRNNYNLTFVVDGESTTTSVAYEAPITAPADPVKEGYTFTGWDAEIAETMPAQDLTYTAQFTINTYAVIYMVDGEEWSRDSVVYGGTIEVKSYEVPEGMLFSGWSSDEEYTTMPAHDVVYSATLTINRIARLLNTTGNVNVYSLNGLLVARNVPVDKLQSILKSGTYIVNGKKINIRK